MDFAIAGENVAQPEYTLRSLGPGPRETLSVSKQLDGPPPTAGNGKDGCVVTWRPLLLLSVVALLAACGHVAPPKLDPDLRPSLTPALGEALATAKECEDPVWAVVNLSADFKYGCFCGKNHPDLPTPGYKPLESLSALERAELIKRYYSIRPIDSIDSACRDHDVCWILRGEGDGRCNLELRRRLSYIYDAMHSGHRIGDEESKRDRCAKLAIDMSVVFSTIVVDDRYKNPLDSAGSLVARTVGTAFVLPFLVTVQPFELSNSPYPFALERCVVEQK